METKRITAVAVTLLVAASVHAPLTGANQFVPETHEVTALSRGGTFFVGSVAVTASAVGFQVPMTNDP